MNLSLFEKLPAHTSTADISVSCHNYEQPPVRDVSFTNGRSAFAGDGFRFRESEIATMDTVGTGLVRVYPGPAWQGTLPSSFYSTLTGALMSWRGGLAIHGSCVEMDGKALVICGVAGAGKSSIAASLISRGARLISDDLTVLRPGLLGHPPAIYPGRLSIRLYPQMAAMVRQEVDTETLPSNGVKELVAPPRTDGAVATPLGGFIILGVDPVEFHAESVDQHFDRIAFRPRLFRKIVGHDLRKRSMAKALRECRVAFCPRIDFRTFRSLSEIADIVLSSWQKTT